MSYLILKDSESQDPGPSVSDYVDPTEIEVPATSGEETVAGDFPPPRKVLALTGPHPGGRLALIAALGALAATRPGSEQEAVVPQVRSQPSPPSPLAINFPPRSNRKRTWADVHASGKSTVRGYNAPRPQGKCANSGRKRGPGGGGRKRK